MSLLKLVLSQVELPTQLYLKYNGVEYRGDRNDIIVAKSVDHFHSVKHSETLITCFFTRPLWLYIEVAQGRRPCHLPLHRNRRGASTPGKWITMCGRLESMLMFRLSCSWQAEMSRESRERAEVRTGTPFVLVLRSAVTETIPINRFPFQRFVPWQVELAAYHDSQFVTCVARFSIQIQLNKYLLDSTNKILIKKQQFENSFVGCLG